MKNKDIIKQEHKEVEKNFIILNLGLGERNKFILIKTRQRNDVCQYFVIGDITQYHQHVYLYNKAKTNIVGEILETCGGLLDITKTKNGIIGRIWGKSNVYYGYKKIELERLSKLIKARLGFNELEIEESKPYSL